MQRWVNDYKIADRIYAGYRPVIPFESKNVGKDTTAILMEMPDAEYKNRFEDKQIKNDVYSPGGGIDLTRFVKQEFAIKMQYESAFWFFKVFIRKIFNKHYMPEFTKKAINVFDKE